MRAQQIGITDEIAFAQADRNAFCAVPAAGMPTNEELAAETLAGADVLVAMHHFLETARRTGRAGGQKVWPFFNGKIPHAELFYVLRHDGGCTGLLKTCRRRTRQGRGPADRGHRLGPLRQRHPCRRTRHVPPAAERRPPLDQPRGRSRRHAALGCGTACRLGMAGFPAHPSAGNGVVYALRKDGELLWYRHRGFRPATASPPGMAPSSSTGRSSSGHARGRSIRTCACHARGRRSATSCRWATPQSTSSTGGATCTGCATRAPETDARP